MLFFCRCHLATPGTDTQPSTPAPPSGGKDTLRGISTKIDLMFDKLKVYAEILRLHPGWENWQQASTHDNIALRFLIWCQQS